MYHSCTSFPFQIISDSDNHIHITKCILEIEHNFYVVFSHFLGDTDCLRDEVDISLVRLLSFARQITVGMVRTFIDSYPSEFTWVTMNKKVNSNPG